MNIKVSNGFIQNSLGNYPKSLVNNKNSSIGNESVAKALNVSDEYEASFSKTLEDYGNNREYSSIISKYETGLELSEEELKILKEKSPKVYREAMMAKMERELYRKKLEKCKSKEETEELKLKQDSKYITDMNNLTGNINARSEKLRIVILERTTSNEHYNFMQTEDYKGLPKQTEEKNQEKESSKIDYKEVDEKEGKVNKDELIEEALNVLNDKITTLEQDALQELKGKI